MGYEHETCTFRLRFLFRAHRDLIEALLVHPCVDFQRSMTILSELQSLEFDRSRHVTQANKTRPRAWNRATVVDKIAIIYEPIKSINEATQNLDNEKPKKFPIKK